MTAGERAGNGGFGHSRKIGDGQRRVRVEVVRLYEALKQIPTHLARLIGAQRRMGEGNAGETKAAAGARGAVACKKHE